MRIPVLALVPLLAACGGGEPSDDTPDDAEPTPTTESPPTETTPPATTPTSTGSTDTAPTADTGMPATPPSFAADIAPLFAAECTPCHVGGGSSGGFQVDTHADVVGPRDNITGLAYVAPGDPAASYLWAKLTDTQLDVGGSGGQMPSGGLLPAQLDLVEAWILAGAQP